MGCLSVGFKFYFKILDYVIFWPFIFQLKFSSSKWIPDKWVINLPLWMSNLELLNISESWCQIFIQVSYSSGKNTFYSSQTLICDMDVEHWHSAFIHTNVMPILWWIFIDSTLCKDHQGLLLFPFSGMFSRAQSLG